MKRFMTIWLCVLLLSSSTLLTLGIDVRGDDNNTIETEHFIIDYQDGAFTIAQEIAEIAESIYPNATEFMNFTPDWKVKITVNHTVEPFHDWFPFGGNYFGGVGYVMYLDMTLMLPPFWCMESTGYSTTHYYEMLFAHEFNHVLLHGKHDASVGPPRWYVEGLAMFYPYDVYGDLEHRTAPYLLYRAIEEDKLLALDEMFGRQVTEEEFNLPYIEGYSIFKYVHSTYGYEKIQEMIETFNTWSQGETTLQNLDRIFNSLFDQNREEFEIQWIDWLKNDYIEEPEERVELNGSPLTDSTQSRVPTSWNDDRILYLDGSNGSLDIYLIDENGGEPTRLTYENGTDSDARFSPDGSRIVFTSLRNGTHDLYLMDVDGRGLTRLTNDQFINVAPCWTPDGERVAFVSDRNGDYDIFTLDLAGNSIEPLIVSPYNDGAPSYSPDGSELAFCSNRDGNFSIHVMNIETNEITKLTNDETNELFPSWSPDGKTISFLSYSENGGLIIYDIGSGERTIVAAGNYWIFPLTSPPVWSPGGEMMCTAMREWTNLTSLEAVLYILDVPEANTWPDTMYLMVGVAVSLSIIILVLLTRRKPKTSEINTEEPPPPSE
ncbi:MAG: PD40 domain-containing protein [Thermoplasmata archaeon]|nr:PD40 domain-containing protein [Thermoplasmata archaeon]